MPEIDEGGFMKTGMMGKGGQGEGDAFHFPGFLRGFRLRIVFAALVLVVHRGPWSVIVHVRLRECQCDEFRT